VGRRAIRRPHLTLLDRHLLLFRLVDRRQRRTASQALIPPNEMTTARRKRRGASAVAGSSASSASGERLAPLSAQKCRLSRPKALLRRACCQQPLHRRRVLRHRCRERRWRRNGRSEAGLCSRHPLRTYLAPFRIIRRRSHWVETRRCLQCMCLTPSLRGSRPCPCRRLRARGTSRLPPSQRQTVTTPRQVRQRRSGRQGFMRPRKMCGVCRQTSKSRTLPTVRRRGTQLPPPSLPPHCNRGTLFWQARLRARRVPLPRGGLSRRRRRRRRALEIQRCCLVMAAEASAGLAS
jgi:hypothetical protein